MSQKLTGSKPTHLISTLVNVIMVSVHLDVREAIIEGGSAKPC